MSLTPGSRLGPYEIVSRLGAGGMGEVYRARDTRLDRSVAIKVLPENLQRNTQVQARFEREARTISQLNHPHICTLHDVGEDNGTQYLVMELVEGETLAARIVRGPMPLPDVIRYGVQIAEALDRAHRAGIVHRDLKPGNVMLTRSGAKLLDFGLARSSRVPIGSPDAPTVQGAITADGTIVGTAPYMPPEQLQGADPDVRSDLFALGAVLYEMTTGRRAFDAKTAVSLIAQILEHDPPAPSQLLPVTPPPLERLIMTCLAKDPDARFQCAADVAHELRWIGSGATATPTLAVPAEKPSRWLWPAAALLVLAGIAGAFAAYRAGRRAAAPPTIAFAQLTFDRGEESHPALSPDGKLFAFVKAVNGRRDVFLQRIDGRSAINLTNTTDVDESEPAFSPDGSLIAFRSERDGGGIFVMGATGESMRRVTDKCFNPAWSPDGKQIVCSGQRMIDPAIVFNIRALYVADVATGATRLFYDALDVLQPAWSPNGHRIAFYAARNGQRDLYTIDAGGAPSSVVAVTEDVYTDWNPVWSPDGRHLYFISDRDGTMTIWRVPVDEKSGRTRGLPERVPAASSNVAFLSISRDGSRMIYESKVETGTLQRISFDPAAEQITVEPQPLFQGSMYLRYPAASPDGKWIAFTGRAPHEDVYVMAADGTGLRQLTNDAARDRGISWWPDSSRIVFYSNRAGEFQAWSIRPDGSGLTQLTNVPGGVDFPKISPDGGRLAFVSDTGASGGIAEIRGTVPVSTATPVPNPPNGRFQPLSWSPDGRRVSGSTFGTPTLHVYTPETKQLVTLPVAARGHAFLDEQRILFVDTSGRIGIANADTRAVTFAGTLPFEPYAATSYGSLSVDRRGLLAYAVRTEGDLWTVTTQEP